MWVCDIRTYNNFIIFTNKIEYLSLKISSVVISRHVKNIYNQYQTHKKHHTLYHTGDTWNNFVLTNGRSDSAAYYEVHLKILPLKCSWSNSNFYAFLQQMLFYRLNNINQNQLKYILDLLLVTPEISVWFGETFCFHFLKYHLAFTLFILEKTNCIENSENRK